MSSHDDSALHPSAAARDSVLTALLHLARARHDRRARDSPPLFAAHPAGAAAVGTAYRLGTCDDPAHVLALPVARADTEQTVLWLSWIARQTQKTLRRMVITGQIRTEDV